MNPEVGMLARSVLVAVALTTAASMASAATIGNISGEVAVNQGSGFVAVYNGNTVNPGDRISVPPGGTANIAFESCTVSVPAGQTFTVPSESPCPPGGASDVTPVVVGSLLVVGAVTVTVIALADNDSDDDDNGPPQLSP